MNTIKEFLIFKQFLKYLSQIDLTEAEKIKLEAADKDIYKKIISKMWENLARELVNDNISPDFVKWYKSAMANFLSYFRKY